MKRHFLLLFLTAASCQAQPGRQRHRVITPAITDPAGTTIASRFRTPPGYQRVAATAGSYADFLRTQPLYPAGTLVRYFDGRVKPNPSIYEAVLRLDRGTTDLQQCADAVMRLRAEWQWHSGHRNEIAFRLGSGLLADYDHWQRGFRVRFDAGRGGWKALAKPDSSYASFRRYLDFIYSYAGTRSLSGELQSVPIRDMHVGDVLIVGGSPGHATTVMDMAVGPNGEKLFMLSQSYMPAQDIQVLCNNQEPEISPWYRLPDDEGNIQTPQWQFSTSDLKRFR